LDPIFYPQSVAVLGASADPSKYGNQILQALIDSKYQGKVYPINPKATEVLGLKAYASILQVPGPVDLALIVIPARMTPQAIRECKSKNVKGAVVISAGFSETGEDGRTLERELVKEAEAAGIRIIGPNCFGIINTDPTVALNAMPGSIIERAGPVGFLSQSGALAEAVVAWAQEQGIGFSKFVSIGNMCDVDFAEMMSYLAEDPRTKVITMYIEGVKNGKEFMHAAKSATERKPVLVLKAGRSEAATHAVMTHTGSLAGSDAVYDTAFKQTGVFRVGGIEELFDCARAMSMQSIPKSNRIGVISHAGGPMVLTCDACETNALQLPSISEPTKNELRKILPSYASVGNPTDVAADAPLERYNKALEIFCKDENLDAIIVVLEGLTCGDGILDQQKWPDTLGATLKACGKPSIVMWMFAQNRIKPGIQNFERFGIPVFSSPERVANAMRALSTYGAYLQDSKQGTD
jgi:acetyl coenzyme A synthetase (ADP forming)-like protein